MRISICVILTIFLCSAYSSKSFAQMSEKEIQTEIADNIAGEYIDCGVYFNLVYEGAEKAGRMELAKQYNDLVDLCYSSAYMLIKSNREEEMAAKVSTSLVSMRNTYLRNEIDNNLSNLSVLSNKYMDSCIDIIKDPTEMMETWSQRVRSKY
jgi:hypothetical protein